MTCPEPETCGLAWIILRCANASTLRLAASLNAAGIEAWAPAEAQPQGKASTPLMPSFVFASAARIGELFALSNSFDCPHPGFWIFRPFGSVALIAEGELAPLRNLERKRKPRGEVRRMAVGTLVRLTEGGFEGLSGTIERTDGKFALVAFARFPVPVKIGMWLLREELDESQQIKVNTLRAA